MNRPGEGTPLTQSEIGDYKDQIIATRPKVTSVAYTAAEGRKDMIIITAESSSVSIEFAISTPENFNLYGPVGSYLNGFDSQGIMIGTNQINCRYFVSAKYFYRFGKFSVASSQWGCTHGHTLSLSLLYISTISSEKRDVNITAYEVSYSTIKIFVDLLSQLKKGPIFWRVRAIPGNNDTAHQEVVLALPNAVAFSIPIEEVSF